MRRFLGVIPLLAYLLATIALAGFAFLLTDAFDSSSTEGNDMFEVLFGVTLDVWATIFAVGIFIIACIPLVMFIFKLIHLITGARFCGIICVLIDVLVTVALFVAAFSDPYDGFIAVVAAAELGCCVCNMASLSG